MSIRTRIRDWLGVEPTNTLRAELDAYFMVNNLCGRFTPEGWAAKQAELREDDLARRVTAQALAECRKAFSPLPPSLTGQGG